MNLEDFQHPANEIIEAVAEAIRAVAPSGVSVHVHRRDSLSELELEAISVDFGDDEPLSDGEGAILLDGTIESVLTVNVTGAAKATDEKELRVKLLGLRTIAHIAIRRQRYLLPFVTSTHYGGANPPDVNTEGDILFGELTSPWGVRYEMPGDGPSQ